MTTRKPLVQISGTVQELPSGDAIADTSVGGTTAGAILFVGNAGVLGEDAANLFWDSANIRLWIGPQSAAITNAILNLGSNGPPELGMTHAGSLTQIGVRAAFNRARGTDTSPTGVASGDSVGLFIFNAYDGVSTYRTCASFAATIIEPTPGPTAMGARLVFSVAALGGVGATEVARYEVGTGISMFGANPVIDNNRIHRPRSYTVGTLPSVITTGIIHVSDDGGGSTLAFSDGTNWRRVSDRAILSTSNPVAQASGSYTPTLTNSVNVTSSTAHTCYWTQIGKIVTVTGTVELTTTTNATDTKLGISLPVAATLSSYDHLSGVANGINAATKNATGVVTGDATNNRAILEFNAIAGADLNTFRFTFTYTL